MYNKLLRIAVALAIMGSVARAAQIGATVQSTLNASQRVNVPGSLITTALPVEITHITLESGVWMIRGQINFVAFGVPNGAVMWTGGNISLDTPSFQPTGTAAFQAEKSWGSNPQRPMALVQRVVEVENGQEVFLVAGNFNPTMTVAAWGFITALKVRNHAPNPQPSKSIITNHPAVLRRDVHPLRVCPAAPQRILHCLANPQPSIKRSSQIQP